MEKIKLAVLPTPVYKLEHLSKQYNKNIYIKRDDLTGIELSGNKIRKLEYTAKQALDQGADLLITCGGIQSNHARATAFVATMLGIQSLLVLRGNNDHEPIEGNYLLDKLAGAHIVIKDYDEFQSNKETLMLELKEEYKKKGYHPYIVPMGASNGIGTLGYMEAFNEIIAQEKELNMIFDTVITAVGSGGTYAGLYAGNELSNSQKDIIGFNVCDNEAYFVKEISSILDDTLQYLDQDSINKEKIKIIDGYLGQGYAKSSKEELTFIAEFAKTQGIILDPVYTAKAYYGFIKELEKETFANSDTILLIHTGGIFGLFAKQKEFDFIN